MSIAVIFILWPSLMRACPACERRRGRRWPPGRRPSLTRSQIKSIARNSGSVTYRHEGCPRKSIDGPVLDGPFHAQPDGLQEPFELPAAGAEGADVADRAHRHLDQAVGIDERLGRRLGLDDALVDVGPGLLHRPGVRVRRVLAADPVEALLAEHLLHVGPVRRPSAKPPGVRKPAGSIPSRALMAAVARRMLSRITSAGVRPSISQGARWKRNWMSSGSRRQHVDVVVGVVADRMAGPHDLLEPVDVLLLEDPADREAVEHARPPP